MLGSIHGHGRANILTKLERVQDAHLLVFQAWLQTVNTCSHHPKRAFQPICDCCSCWLHETHQGDILLFKLQSPMSHALLPVSHLLTPFLLSPDVNELLWFSPSSFSRTQTVLLLFLTCARRPIPSSVWLLPLPQRRIPHLGKHLLQTIWGHLQQPLSLFASCKGYSLLAIGVHQPIHTCF